MSRTLKHDEEGEGGIKKASEGVKNETKCECGENSGIFLSHNFDYCHEASAVPDRRGRGQLGTATVGHRDSRVQGQADTDTTVGYRDNRVQG